MTTQRRKEREDAKMSKYPKTKHGLKIGFQAFAMACGVMLVLLLPITLIGHAHWWEILQPAVACGLGTGIANGVLHGRDYEPNNSHDQ